MEKKKQKQEKAKAKAIRKHVQKVLSRNKETCKHMEI